ncbi:hypothetical protein K502DRAFT_109642 [Neoconidiobolus thromboides FSU 785]|nr:hypothetical protein K502DRAFT_109642 [Neoconidiobolus thromboides FSU 785]
MDILIPAFHHQLGEECTRNIISEGINSYCFNLFLSKIVGLSIILFSIFSKIPQLAKVYQTQSSEGLNAISLYIETGVLTIISCYCFRNQQGFTTYGDAVFVLLQDIFLVSLILLVNKKTDHFLMFVSINLVVNYLFYFVLTVEQLTLFMMALLPAAIFGAFPQLYENFKNKSIGVLSPLTIYINFLNALGRVFTNWIEVDDTFAIIGSVIGFVVNVIFVIQVLAYSKPPKKQNKKDQ